MTKGVVWQGKRRSAASVMASLAPQAFKGRRSSFSGATKVPSFEPVLVSIMMLQVLSSHVAEVVEKDDGLLREYRLLQLHVAVGLRLGCCDYPKLLVAGDPVIEPDCPASRLCRVMAKHVERVIKLGRSRACCSCVLAQLEK